MVQASGIGQWNRSIDRPVASLQPWALRANETLTIIRVRLVHFQLSVSFVIARSVPTK